MAVTEDVQWLCGPDFSEEFISRVWPWWATIGSSEWWDSQSFRGRGWGFDQSLEVGSSPHCRSVDQHQSLELDVSRSREPVLWTENRGVVGKTVAAIWRPAEVWWQTVGRESQWSRCLDEHLVRKGLPPGRAAMFILHPYVTDRHQSITEVQRWGWWSGLTHSRRSGSSQSCSNFTGWCEMKRISTT